MELLNDSLSSELASLKFPNSPDLESNLTRYQRKKNQCNLIIRRVKENTNRFRIIDEKLWKLPDIERGSKHFDEEEIKLANLHSKIISEIGFDTEDYFIHTQILLDRLSSVIGCFLPDLPKDAKGKFIAHMRFLITHDCSDLEYTEYVRKNTKWFNLLLNVHRNNLIVHDRVSVFSGTSFSKNKIPSPIRLRFPESEESKRVIEQLNKIKANHIYHIGELHSEENIWKMLLLFDYNADKLSEDEIKTIIEIHKNFGGELPQIDKVNIKVQEFLDFVGSHFLN